MELLTLSISGAIVSLIVQAIKKWGSTNEYTTIGIVVVLSIVAGAIYHYLANTPFWTTAYQILISAGAVYTFLIQRVENSTPPPIA